MIRTLGELCCKLLNLLPAKGGVSKYYNPYMIMKKRNLNYNKDFKHLIGDYGMANAPTDNTMKARAIEAIYLQPIESAQAGHECMNLITGKTILSTRFEPLLITKTVIQQVERLATKQGIQSFKITNQEGETLYDSAKTAGVNEEEASTTTTTTEDNESTTEEYEEYKLYNEEFKEVDEPYKNEKSDNEESEYSTASKEEANYEQNNDKDNNDNDDDNENDEDYESQGDTSEGTTEDADGHKDEESERPRRSTQTTKEVERLEPRWRGQMYHQTDKEVKKIKHKIKKIKNKIERMKYSNEEVQKDLEYSHNIMYQSRSEANMTIEYNHYQAIAMARLINEFRERVNIKGYSYAQQYILNKGLKMFGNRGKKALMTELDQLYRRNCFTPVSIKDMSMEERQRAQVALMFLTEKRDKSVKGRMVYNGKPTREWLSREESASPTAVTESIILTAFIDAYKQRDVMTADVPNAFIQAELPRGTENDKNNKDTKDNNNRVMMKITGVLVDMLVQLDPNAYSKHVIYNNGKKTLYVWVLRALYGMLTSSLLWYKKFRKDLENYGFVFNPYDPCVASRKEKGQQHTIRFHVDDIMSSHRDKQVNTVFGKWLNMKYGKHKPVELIRSNRYEFLGMNFDFTEPKVLKIDMCGHVDDMVDIFPIEFEENNTSASPAGEKLFEEGTGEALNKMEKEQFHTTVAKGLYISKRARPDIQLAVAVLCTRVQQLNKNDWDKLIRLLKFLNGTRNKRLRITADNLSVIKWYVDASFAVHPDYKSHTGATMLFDEGKGSKMNLSRKQKLNTRSSTESE